MKRSRRAIRLCCLCTLMGAACAAASAAAWEPTEQGAEVDLAQSRDYSDFRYGLTVQEYLEIVDRLELDEEQLAIADAMHSELRRSRFEAEQEYLEAQAELDAWRLSMRDGTGPEDRKERRRRYTAIVTRLNTSHYDFIKQDIERAEAFLDDLRLVMHPDLIEDFEAVLRWRIRHRQLRWGALPYTRVDLVAIVDEMAEAGELELDRERFGGEAEGLFDAALFRYEKELDRQLRRLIEIEADEPNGARAHGRTTLVRDFDNPHERERWRARFGEASWRLGELQRRHAGLVRYYLTEDARSRFDELVVRRAYWPPYHSSNPDKLIKRLLSTDELTDAQRSAIEHFALLYRGDRAAADQRWRDALDALVAQRDVRVTASFTPITVVGRLDHGVAGFDEFRDAHYASSRLNRDWIGRMREYAVEQQLLTVDDR